MSDEGPSVSFSELIIRHLELWNDPFDFCPRHHQPLLLAVKLQCLLLLLFPYSVLHSHLRQLQAPANFFTYSCFFLPPTSSCVLVFDLLPKSSWPGSALSSRTLCGDVKSLIYSPVRLWMELHFNFNEAAIYGWWLPYLTMQISAPACLCNSTLL